MTAMRCVFCGRFTKECAICYPAAYVRFGVPHEAVCEQCGCVRAYAEPERVMTEEGRATLPQVRKAWA